MKSKILNAITACVAITFQVGTGVSCEWPIFNTCASPSGCNNCPVSGAANVFCGLPGVGSIDITAQTPIYYIAAVMPTVLEYPGWTFSSNPNTNQQCYTGLDFTCYSGPDCTGSVVASGSNANASSHPVTTYTVVAACGGV